MKNVCMLLLECEHQITICFLFVCLPSHSSHYWSYNACHYEILSFRSGTPLRHQRPEVRSLVEIQNFSSSPYRKFPLNARRAYFLWWVELGTNGGKYFVAIETTHQTLSAILAKEESNNQSRSNKPRSYSSRSDF